MHIAYLGCLAVVDDTACISGMGGWVNHAVIRTRHFVADGPDVTIVVESLAVIHDISNAQDGNNSYCDRQLDVALVVSFDDLNLARLGQSWSLLVCLVNTLGFLSSRADIGDSRWDRGWRLGFRLFGSRSSRNRCRGTSGRWG